MFNCFKKVLDAPPIQCYAFTQGHVISVMDSMDKVDLPGRYLLYSNRLRSFEVNQTKFTYFLQSFFKILLRYI